MGCAALDSLDEYKLHLTWKRMAMKSSCDNDDDEGEVVLFVCKCRELLAAC